ncbi:hypothetical protein ACWYRQ_14290 [Clostridioides difficile]
MYERLKNYLHQLVARGEISPEGKTFEHDWHMQGFETPEDYNDSLQVYSLRDSDEVRAFNEYLSKYL